MRITEILAEAWSQKYKSSINCSHPRGFSQKAHCAGKKKHNESIEMEMVCESCGMCETHGNITEIKKGQKDANGVTKCWPGKHAEGTKKGKNGGQVRNCVPNESVAEGAFDIFKKLPPSGSTVKIAGRPVEISYGSHGGEDNSHVNFSWNDTNGKEHYVEARVETITNLRALAKRIKSEMDWVEQQNAKQGVAEGLHEQFDLIEEMVESLAEEHGVDADVIWEDFESVDDHELLETAAWRRKEGKSKKGGLNAKGVASYRRENPGSKLQTAVTTKPSKLKPGSKAAKRRKSFCARMGGVKGPMKKPNGKPTRKALALRKWNC
jgi:hypothetical protein